MFRFGKSVWCLRQAVKFQSVGFCGSLLLHGAVWFVLSHSGRKSLTSHSSGRLRRRLIPALALMTQESFRYWQARSIDQKQSASALMLGLSAGALAFTASLLGNSTTFIGCFQSVLFHLHGAMQICSIGTGVFFSLNRVRDFDLTAQVARKREKNRLDPVLPTMRSNLRKWGRITRRLYFWQGTSFVVGAVLFLWFVLLRHSASLYTTVSVPG